MSIVLSDVLVVKLRGFLCSLGANCRSVCLRFEIVLSLYYNAISFLPSNLERIRAMGVKALL